MIAPKELHWAWWDDAQQRGVRRAVCGKWVAPSELAKRDEGVTCADCQVQIQRFEDLTRNNGDEPSNPF